VWVICHQAERASDPSAHQFLKFSLRGWRHGAQPIERRRSRHHNVGRMLTQLPQPLSGIASGAEVKISKLGHCVTDPLVHGAASNLPSMEMGDRHPHEHCWGHGEEQFPAITQNNQDVGLVPGENPAHAFSDPNAARHELRWICLVEVIREGLHDALGRQRECGIATAERGGSVSAAQNQQ
jgi:hypothetical protein